MSAGAVIIIRQNQLIRAFREADAMDAENAVTLASLGKSETWIFRRMCDAGVFVAVGDGRYYLSAEGAETFIVRRWRRISVSIGVFLALLLALMAIKMLSR